MISKEDSVSEAAGMGPYFVFVRTLKWADVESLVKYKRDAERYLRSVTNEVLSSKENWIYAAKKTWIPLAIGGECKLWPNGGTNIRNEWRRR